MKESTSQAAAALNARATAYNGGSIRYYQGTMPASVAAGVGSDTLLAQMTFGATAFATTSTNTLTANAITQDTSADATGTIGYAACFSSGGTLISLHTVGTSGAEITVNTVNVVAGLPVTMSSFTITQPLS
jgi:hypothetical protein